MSRSYKKIGILKDKSRNHSRWYNKPIRRRNKQEVRDIIRLKDVEDYEITSPKTIINQYDICDYKFRWDDLKRVIPEKLKQLKRLYFNK